MAGRRGREGLFGVAAATDGVAAVDWPARGFDVVIVGAGSAGCVLAERLSRDRSRTVLLVERGPAGRPADRRLAVLPIGPGAPYARSYDTVSGAPAAVRGQGLGGSSSINGGYFLRWHRADVDMLAGRGGWTAAEISDAYHELDGSGGTMRVHPWSDDDLVPVTRSFEEYWSSRVVVREPEARDPVVGLNRVLTNSDAGQRVSAFDGYLQSALARPNLSVVTGTEVTAVATVGGRASGVRLHGPGDDRVQARRVISCAGTFGTAELLFRSGLRTGPLPLTEHREMLTKYRARQRAQRALPTSVLQSVVHTAGGVEIRCYTDDFARFVSGVPASGSAFGVAQMTPGTPGSLVWHDGALRIDLGGADWHRTKSLAPSVAAAVADVRDMLSSPEFAGAVIPDSLLGEELPATSQHACATLPLGVDVGGDGELFDVPGLHVVDGSILPVPGRSGPHATIMALAVLIGDRLRAR